VKLPVLILFCILAETCLTAPFQMDDFYDAQKKRQEVEMGRMQLEQQKIESQRRQQQYEQQQRKNENNNAYKTNDSKNQNTENTRTQEQTNLENKLIESTAKAQALQQQLNEIKEKDIAKQKAQSTCKDLGFKLGSSKYLKCIDKLGEFKAVNTDIKTESSRLLTEKSRLNRAEPEVIISTEPMFWVQAKSQCERLNSRLASTQEILNLYNARKVINLNWVWTSNEGEEYQGSARSYIIFNTTTGEKGTTYVYTNEPLHFICIK